MKLSPAAVAGSVLLTARQQTADADVVDYNAAPPNLSTLANVSLYNTWRPRAHVLPPFGQIGDPCMHYTDPETGTFHVGFLHNGAAGATTDDLVTYYDLNADGGSFISPGGINDPVAVFDGSVIPSGIDGKPTLLYTSVSFLPIQWTVNYTRGSETQSLAVTYDGGHNFSKVAQGPVIPDAPFALNVTGFRDPFVFQNARLDALLDSKNETWYVVISGGTHGNGPSQFLYRQHDAEFQYWEYLGPWWKEPVNSTWSENNWAGRWGFNFEVGNVFSLDADGYNSEGDVFITLGAEWSVTPIVPQVSDYRDMLWAAGDVAVVDGQPRFTPNMAGRLDWGFSAYAAAGKVLPTTSLASTASGAPDRFISYVWLTGDIYGTSEFPTAQQNWTGSLLLPRELRVGKIQNVVDNALSCEQGSWRTVDNCSGLVELETLQQKIAREPLAALRSGQLVTEPGRTLNASGTVPFSQSPSSKFYLLSANLSFPASARGSNLKAGFQILASDMEWTTIYYQFSNESVIIDRGNSSAASKTTDGIISDNEVGQLRLFDIMQGNEQQIEALRFTIVVDNAVVEVHANERFAVSTWVRSWYANSTDIRFFVEGDDQVVFGDVDVYEGLYNAWPGRETA